MEFNATEEKRMKLGSKTHCLGAYKACEASANFSKKLRIISTKFSVSPFFQFSIRFLTLSYKADSNVVS